MHTFNDGHKIEIDIMKLALSVRPVNFLTKANAPSAFLMTSDDNFSTLFQTLQYRAFFCMIPCIVDGSSSLCSEDRIWFLFPSMHTLKNVLGALGHSSTVDF